MRWRPALAGLAMAAGLAALTAGPALAGPAASPGPGSFGVRLPDVPAAQAHDPRAVSSVIAVLRPGTVIHREIQVLNDEPRPAAFAVYAGAAQISAGQFIGEAGAARNELTGWVTVRHPVLRLPAYASGTEQVTIAVPRVATRGQHYGVIWVQQAATVRPHHGVAIVEVNRVGVRMYVTISHGAAPVNFTIGPLAARWAPDGQPEIVVPVSNTGGQAVDVDGTARLTHGPGGTSAAQLAVRRVLTLAPGQSGTVAFLGSRGLPVGPWQARVTLTSGLTTRTASAVLSFPASRSSVPYLAGGGAVLVGLLAAGTVMARRGRPRVLWWR